MSGGMCPICQLKPHAAGHGYCSDCHARYQRQRYHRRKADKWRSDGKKSPPTDWREVLRKADEKAGKP